MGNLEHLSAIEQYPKVPELWDHRRYVLRCLIRSQQCILCLLHASFLVTPELLAAEVEHCYTMCDLYPRNYYSWTTLQVLLPEYSYENVRNEFIFKNVDHV